MKSLLVLSFVLFFGYQSFSQVWVSYQFSTTDKMAVGYQFNQHIWSDFRLHNVKSFDHLTFDLIVFNNFIHHQNFDFYLGGGLSVDNFFESGELVIPVGIQFKPFTIAPNLFFSFEIDNYFDDFDNGIYMPFAIGVRYKLN